MRDTNFSATKEKKSFWDTTLGVITKITALLTAVTGLIIAVKAFTGNISSEKRVPATETSPKGSDDGNNGGDTSPEKEVSKKANLVISAFSVQPDELTLDKSAAAKPITIHVEAYNNGNDVATQCRFTVLTSRGTLGSAASPSFSLDAGEKRSFDIEATIGQSGDIKARLDCSNAESKESTATPVTVWLYGQMHTRPPRSE